MNLKEILSILPTYKVIHGNVNISIQTVEMDHRNIQHGDVFICMKGFTVDGHDYAEKAVANGATVIIAERDISFPSVTTILVPDTTRALALIAAKYYHFPTEKLSLIGITGTNGKTTTTYLIEKIFQTHQQQTGLIGTIQMKIGEETFPVKNTTPDALSLQKTFRQMVDKEVDIAIMEVSSHALDLGRVYGCDFDVAVFTNLSQDHLDYHDDLDDYLRAKTLLFTSLGNAYGKERKYAILNADDKKSDVIKKSTAQPILTYGVKSTADIMAKDITYDLTSTSFTVTTPNEEIHMTSSLMGQFNVYNMLAAIAVAYVKKVPLPTIKLALEEISGIDGRFEQVNMGQDFAVIVDYAHTPDSLENVLETIKKLSKHKIYVVVGTGGDRDRMKRPLMAKVALKYSDFAIFTSDNPRTEDPKAILDDMTNGLEGEHYEVIENRREAIQHAIHLAKEGDIVLIAGKGHETYQEIHGVRYDFDDRVVAKEAIQKKGI